jgi:hypothetical protein
MATVPVTKGDLQNAFGEYLRQMERLHAAPGLYWALLHIVVLIPDICGSLEASDGEASGDAYKSWCRRYLTADPLTDPLNPEERWWMRCALLHTGRSGPSASKPSRYKAYEFHHEECPLHGQEMGQEQPRERLPVHLDVPVLYRGTLAGMNKWFEDVMAGARGTEFVATHLPRMLRVRPSVASLKLGGSPDSSLIRGRP